jgi:hypothetical protein
MRPPVRTRREFLRALAGERGAITFARFDVDRLRGTADYWPDPSAA